MMRMRHIRHVSFVFVLSTLLFPFIFTNKHFNFFHKRVFIMTTVNSIKGEIDIQRLPVDSEEHTFNNWVIKYRKSHILHSQCTTNEKCSNNAEEKCQFCM